MTERFEITGLSLREMLDRNPGTTRVTVEHEDGSVWTYTRSEGLRVKAGDRTLKIPDSAFEQLVSTPQWSVADAGV